MYLCLRSQYIIEELNKCILSFKEQTDATDNFGRLKKVFAYDFHLNYKIRETPRQKNQMP